MLWLAVQGPERERAAGESPTLGECVPSHLPARFTGLSAAQPPVMIPIQAGAAGCEGMGSGGWAEQG